MKKIIQPLLAAAILAGVLSLTGCGSDKTSSTTTTTTTSEQPVAPPPASSSSTTTTTDTSK